MIGFAGKEDIPRLREIWKACFGDPDSYLDFYYRSAFPLFRTAVDRERGGIASMLTIVPASYRCGEKTVRAAYLYAVGTAPERRGEGRSSRLIRETHAWLLENGIPVSFLFPASESLYRFYGRLGYRTGFSVKEIVLHPGREETPCAVTRCARETFLQKSGAYVGRFPAATLFEPAALGYFYDEIFATGGEVVELCSGALQGYAVCYTIRGTLFVKETDLSGEEVAFCAPALAAHFDAGEIRARVGAAKDGAKVPHGMLCVLNGDETLLPPDESGYMNLVLD